MTLLLRPARRPGVPAMGAAVLLVAAAAPLPACAQDTLPEVEVIGVTPMPGTGVLLDRVPAVVQTLTDHDLDRVQPRNLTDLAERTLRGVSVTDVQNSPYQQNLSYRGFTLSPLLGEPQGLAVYLNGIRINEGFGDTLQWDLVPDAAIRRIDLVGGNPAYGLNALGGALSLQTHSGESFRGAELVIKGGSHGRLDAAAQAGGKRNATSVYVAAERGEEDGWRDHSDSTILRTYLDVTHQLDRGSLGFLALAARTELTGNGGLPRDVLAVRRESVFTYPDLTENQLGMFGVRGEYDISDDLRISGIVYHRDLERDTINGDEFDGAFDDGGFLLAGEVDDGDDNGNGAGNGDGEDEEEARVLFGSVGGMGVPKAIRLDGDDEEGDDVTPGARNLTFTDTTTQGISLQADLSRGMHRLVLGTAYDRSETTFSGRTLVGRMEEDRNVPALLFDGQPLVVTHECERDDFEEDDGSCEEDLEESEVGPLRVVSDSSAWGVYVSDTMAVAERTDLTLSGRYDTVRIDLKIDQDDPESHTFRRFNPAAGLTHRLTDSLAVFGGYREAMRAPTAAELGCADPDQPCRLPNAFVADPPLKEVVTRSVEGGIRGDLGTPAGALAWELAAYASVNKDDIVFVAVPETGAQPGLGYFQNYGETRRMGFDGQIGGRFDRWDWSANYSFIRATFADDNELPGANHPLGREIEGGDEAKVIDVKSGDRIPGIPEHSFKAGVGYTWTNGLRIGTSWLARSGVYLRGDESNQLARTGRYSVVDLTFDWTIGGLTLFGRIENLLGEDYETFGILGECEYEGGDECEGEVVILNHGLEDDVHHTAEFLSPGAPRSYYVGLRYRF